MWYEGSQYENAGPKAKDVRIDMIANVKWFNLKTYPKCLSSQKLKEIINKVIPDNRNDFGSYRNYYYVKKNIIKEIEKELMDYIIEDFKICRAKRVLKRELTPLIIHKLYKVGGMRYKETKAHFEKLRN